jgi:sphingolipid 8-(E)-desaturase
MRDTRRWTRSEVAGRILAGDTLFIRDGRVIKVPKFWLDQHPGGELAILHFVGRDATDETNAFHSPEALSRMMSFSVGTVDVENSEGWQAFVPPVMLGWIRKGDHWSQYAQLFYQGPAENQSDAAVSPTQFLLVQKATSKGARADGPNQGSLEPFSNGLSTEVQRRHSLEYQRLHKEIIDKNLYETPFITGYGPELIRYLSLASISLLAYRHSWFMTSAIFLGALWHQLAFIAHDLGHNGVTHIWSLDRIIGIFVADLLGGLSIGWWVDVSDLQNCFVLSKMSA